MATSRRNWIVDLLFGGLLGAITGAVVALNVMIFSGAEEGYETSIAELFRQNVAVGVVVVLILLAGPVVGIVVARRQRRRRSLAGGSALNAPDRGR